MTLTDFSIPKFKEQGVSMRTRLFMAMIVVLVTVPMFQAAGQGILRDPNIPDTVRLGCPIYKNSALIGDSIEMPVYLFNDELIPGMSLGFIMDTSRVKFLSFRTAPEILALGWAPQRSIKDYWPKGDGTRDSSKQSIIFGGVDFSGAYTSSIPPVTGSSAQFYGTISLLIRPGSTAGWYNLDSAQVGPGGKFVLSGVFLKDGIGPDVDSSFSIYPQYHDCGTTDFLLVGDNTPTIVSVSPDRAFAGDNLWVSIVGQNTHFGQGSSTITSVWFSQASPTAPPIYADQVNVYSSVQLSAHFAIPTDAPLGSRDVSVQNQGDPEPVTKQSGFYIYGRPELVSVDPDSSWRGANLWVSITGVNTHFDQSSSLLYSVWFRQGSSTIIASSLSVQSSTLLNALFHIPEQAPLGLWDVAADALTLTNGFTIYDVLACGDMDGSGQVDLSDVVYLINYVFAGGPPPQDMSHGDVDCSFQTDVSDAVYMINYIFGGGPAPCEGPLCGRE